MSRISLLRFTDTFQKTQSVKKMKMPSKSLLKADGYEQFCFMSDDSEEFYSLNSTTPSEDIWKKFELLPTPPRSPKREPYSDFSLVDETSDISGFLDDDIFLNPNLSLPFPESPPPNQNLHSNLIQDCMWSGSQPGQGDAITQLSKTSNGHLDEAPTSDCVDPAAVFPYPINETRLHNLGTETPSDSEDEEVDVVSTGDEKNVTQAVQVNQKHCALKPSPKSSSIGHMCVQRTNSCVKVKSEPQEGVSNSDCAAISVHNYSLPYSHGIKRVRSTHSQFVVSHKRCKREPTEPVLKSVARKLKSSEQLDFSDSEEGGEGKRTLHNVLERKRRNDLKDSFYILRDHVPELDCKEKAPKVLILRKASEYVHSLRRTDIRYTRELNHLKERNEILHRKLELLQQEDSETDDEYSLD